MSTNWENLMKLDIYLKVLFILNVYFYFSPQRKNYLLNHGLEIKEWISEADIFIIEIIDYSVHHNWNTYIIKFFLNIFN